MRHAFAIAPLLILAAALCPGGQVFAAGLPGGASALNETHGDWAVTCSAADGNARCAISQVQVNNENQRVLSVELAATEGGTAAGGMLVLPFGLALDNGVALSIDEAAAMPTFRFSTCLPAGCLVPLAFDRDTLAAIRGGTALQAKAAANGNGQEVKFSISLTGFTAALSRAAELTTP